MSVSIIQRKEIKEKLMDFPLVGQSIMLDLAKVEDAEFILGLRLDENKNQFLSPVSADIEKQRSFIQNSLGNPDEFYFLIKTKDGKNLGTIRLYDLREDSFCWGSFIIVNGRPSGTAKESIELLYDFGFNVLGFDNTHFDARNENSKAINFYLWIGAEVVSRNNQDTFFRFSKDLFEKRFR